MIPTQLVQNEIEVLRAEVSHFKMYIDLPLHHRDPFDRLLIAQSKAEDMPVVGKDEVFEEYSVELLW